MLTFTVYGVAVILDISHTVAALSGGARPQEPEKSEVSTDTAKQRRLLEMAFAFHVGVEGEYGCPGQSCPGVQRLVAKFTALEGVGRFDYIEAAGAAREEVLQRQLDAVDYAIGFPTDEGFGRIEVIEQLKSLAAGARPPEPAVDEEGGC